MNSFFENPEKYDVKELVDKILRLQADCSWSREIKCLEEHGLSSATRILDIGTGNGHQLCRMAKRYPDKKFVGIEVSEPLVTLALDSAHEMGLANIEFIHDKCPTSRVEGDFDFILARLTIYCAQNREELLSWAHEILKNNARIAIVDMDYDWLYNYPQNPIIQKMFQVHRREFENGGADCSMGKKLPFILQRAGFRDVSCEVKTWWSSFGLTDEQFLELFSAYGAFSTKVAPDLFSNEDYADLISYLNEIISSKSGTVVYPLFVVCGVR